jgi:hypothetical protein
VSGSSTIHSNHTHSHIQIHLMREEREKNLIPQRATLTADTPIPTRIVQRPLAPARRERAAASDAGEAARGQRESTRGSSSLGSAAAPWSPTEDGSRAATARSGDQGEDGGNGEGEDAKERRRDHGSPASTSKSTTQWGTSGRSEGARSCAPAGDEEMEVTAMGPGRGGSPGGMARSPFLRALRPPASDPTPWWPDLMLPAAARRGEGVHDMGRLCRGGDGGRRENGEGGRGTSS